MLQTMRRHAQRPRFDCIWGPELEAAALQAVRIAAALQAYMHGTPLPTTARSLTLPGLAPVR